MRSMRRQLANNGEAGDVRPAPRRSGHTPPAWLTNPMAAGRQSEADDHAHASSSLIACPRHARCRGMTEQTEPSRLDPGPRARSAPPVRSRPVGRSVIIEEKACSPWTAR